MPSKSASIINKLGLHARAAAKLTHVAGEFQCEIWLSRSGRRVNAKSIMGVMMLAAGKGSEVLIEADGVDADAALAALGALIADRFGEGE
jgi:phosphocarrier protein HPr